MRMKPRVSMIVSLGIFLLLAGSIIQAQANPTFIIDEYGPWYYQPDTNQPWVVRNVSVGTDPSGSGLSVLYFTGANSPTPLEHDVYIYEYGSTTELSDIIRFWSAGNGPTYIIFYSGDTSGGAPADTGFPGTTNQVGSVYENSGGSFSFPISTGATFIGYSDSHAPNPIPEPTTTLFLGMGLIGLVGLRSKIGK
jgi:PEP-CTERM motif-containing protein